MDHKNFLADSHLCMEREKNGSMTSSFYHLKTILKVLDAATGCNIFPGAKNCVEFPEKKRFICLQRRQFFPHFQIKNKCLGDPRWVSYRGCLRAGGVLKTVLERESLYSQTPYLSTYASRNFHPPKSVRNFLCSNSSSSGWRWRRGSATPGFP